jgi:hypothetical protein
MPPSRETRVRGWTSRHRSYTTFADHGSLPCSADLTRAKFCEAKAHEGNTVDDVTRILGGGPRGLLVFFMQLRFRMLAENDS